MMLLRRHDLVWLSSKGWHDHVLPQAADAVAAECLAHWLARRLPLVVARQTLGDPALALGLAAPAVWEKRRLSLKVPRDAVLYHDRFPKAADIRHLCVPRHAAVQRVRLLIEALSRIAGPSVEEGKHLAFAEILVCPLSHFPHGVGVEQVGERGLGDVA